MATSLDAKLELTGTGSFDAGRVDSSATDEVSIGSNTWPEASWTIADGTAAGQCNAWWHDQRTLAASTGESLDLAAGLTDPFGSSITFTAVRVLLVQVVDPDGTKAVRVGPQNTANAWQGPWGGTGADSYSVVRDALFQIDLTTGWTVTASTADLLRVVNPSGADPVSYQIWVLGTK